MELSCFKFMCVHVKGMKPPLEMRAKALDTGAFAGASLHNVIL